MTVSPISDGNPLTNDLARADTYINAPSFKRQSVTSSGSYQFTSYYGADGKLIVGRRKQSAGTWSDWTLRRTEFTSFNLGDPHNTSTLAIDGDGYLHISWGLHDNSLLYTRSDAPVTNDAPFTLHGDALGNGTNGSNTYGSALPLNTAKVTYPEFYNVPGSSGDLLMAYRTGRSGNGDYQLVRWVNASQTWTPVRVGSAEDSENPWIDSDYAGDALPNANAYLNTLTFEPGTNDLLVTWCYRYNADSPTTNPHFFDYQTNHNLFYARGTAASGYSTWTKRDGTVYERAGLHDIDEGNAEVALSIPEGSSLINQGSMTVDAQGRPVVATWYAPLAGSGNHRRQYMLNWFDGTTWRESQISNRAAENGDARVGEGALFSFGMARPIVVVDDAGRVIVVYRDWQRGNVVTVAWTDAPDRDEWTTLDLTADSLGVSWEPSYDMARWERDGVLSLYYQPLPGGGITATQASILEWDAAAYFASLPEPGAMLAAFGCAAVTLRRRRVGA